jgi:hypothetical protein
MSEEKLMSSAKVWAYRELSGKKYFEVLLDDGTRVGIDFLEGLTTQQSFVALSRALERKLGSCCITAMNKRSLFDESEDFPKSNSASFLGLWVPPCGRSICPLRELSL